MRNRGYALIFVVAALALPAGCSKEKLRQDFGESTVANITVQTINHAGVPDDKAAAVDGQKLEKAVERYRNDRAETSRGKLLSEMGN